MKKKKSILFFSCLVFFLFLVFFVFVQARELEIKYPTIPGIEIPTTTETSFAFYIKYIFNLAIMLSGVIAFFAFVVGGVRYLTSGGSPVIKKDASDQIAAGFFSLIILLSSYLILFSINPQLTVFNEPEIEKISSPEISPLPPEKRIFVFKEIPTGYMIDKLFEKEKMKKIDDLSKEIKQRTEELRNLAKELQQLTRQCKCENCNKNCPGCQGIDCTYSSCLSCPSCEEDPCRNRVEINRKKDEILRKVAEIRELKEKLDKQKRILINDLQDLEKAEKLMQECYDQVINYNNLVSIKNVIENIKIEKEENWQGLAISADEANFYCFKNIVTYEISQ